MSEQPPGKLRVLAEVLEAFESRTDSFDPHEVAHAVRALAREWESSDRTPSPEMHAEWLALVLTENYGSDESFTWGTYYGPFAVFADPQGARIERPSIDDITPEVIAYWQERAHTARHPLLRMRYADLVWEFGRHARLASSAELPTSCDRCHR